MSREFNNGVTTDLMTYALTDLVGPEQYAYGTLLAVVRIMEPTDNTWMSIIEGNAPTSGEVFAMGRRNSGGLYYAEGSSPQDSSDTPASGSAWTLSDSDNWCIVAITKPTGTAAASFHKIPIGGSRTTAVCAATQNNANPVGVSITLGGAADPGYMRLAVAAILHGIVLTTTQLDAIASAKTTQSIAALCDANSWLVDDSDGFSTNLVAANTHRTAINGTTDNADDPAGWTYGIAALNQKGYAVSDSVDGAWTDNAAGTSLAAAIDEITISTADYIQSEVGPVNSPCRVKAFNSLLTPQAGTRTLRWSTGKDSASGATINMTIKLYEGGGNSIGGGSLVNSFVRNGVSDTPTTYDETVTGSITNYADLYVEFWANQA